MQKTQPITNIEQTSDFVNPSDKIMSTPSPRLMIHHKERNNHDSRYSCPLVYNNSSRVPYGVSRPLLTPGLLIKRHERIRAFMEGTLNLTQTQAEVCLRLVRTYSYYGVVYPKATQVAYAPNREAEARYGIINPRSSVVTGDRGCSVATFWRTIRKLEDSGLLVVTNRYINRSHAQISNLYRLDKLIMAIVRYLAEHGTKFVSKYLEPYLQLPGSIFWRVLFPCQEIRAGPRGLNYQFPCTS